MYRWLSCLLLTVATATASHAQTRDPAVIDAEVRRMVADTGARGLALAVIDDGQVAYVNAWGERNTDGTPLTTDTVMYGASLTKAVFAYTVMQLVEEGVLDLDRPIAEYLDEPLPDFTTPTSRDDTRTGAAWARTNAGDASRRGSS